MKKEMVILLFILIIGIYLVNSEEVSKSSYVPGEVIVKYKDNVIGNGNEVIINNGREVLIYEYVERPEIIEKIINNLER